MFLPDPSPATVPPPLCPVPLLPSSQDVLLAPLPCSKTTSYPQYQLFPRTVVTPLLNVESLGLKGFPRWAASRSDSAPAICGRMA